MTVKADVYGYLSGLAGLTAIVSDRIYPVYVPQNATMPAVRFETTNDGGMKDFDGQGDTRRIELQLDFVALTLEEATTAAAAVTADLRNKTGAFGASFIHAVFLQTEFQTFETTIGDGVYRHSQAWTLHVI